MDIKMIVKEMVAAGMPESEILSNLKELGVSDAESILAEAKAGSKAAGAKQKQSEGTVLPNSQKDSLFKEKPADLGSDLFGASDSSSASTSSLFSLDSGSKNQVDVPTRENSLSGLGSDHEMLLETEKKVDELIALTKSLLDLNKKILESNREMLLRMPK